MKFDLVKKPGPEDLLKSFSDCKKYIYKKDEFLFHKSDPINYLDLLVEGKIQIFKYDANYNEITLNFFTPVSLIAEWAVINEIPYPASGRFIQESTILRMPIREFKSRLEVDISLNHIVMYSLIGKIDTLNMTINRGLTMDSTQKVVHFLYYSPTEFLDLKQNQIASMLCLRPETLSRILKQLKDKDLIDTDKGRITVKNRETLGTHLDP